MKTAEAKISPTATTHQRGRKEPFFGHQQEGAVRSIASETSPFFFKPVSVQAKLTVGQPNDKYEQEADAVADKVVQKLSEPNLLQTKSTKPVIPSIQAKQIMPITHAVQPKCAECEKEEENTGENITDQKLPLLAAGLPNPPSAPEVNNFRSTKKAVQLKGNTSISETIKPVIQNKPIFESDAKPELPVQRKCETCEEEENLQKKESSGSEATVSPSIESRLTSFNGSGSSLPEPVRNNMESSIGVDFSNVKIHTDNSAVQMNKDLHAQAFTHGNDIYFNSGNFNPESKDGQHLLAHELTHTVQQGTASMGIQKQDAPAEHLTSLNEMLNRFDVPENQVIDLLRQLTPTEKATVNSDVTYRIKMAAAFNTGEMVRAVIKLNPSLIQKLEWVEAAAGSAQSIDYSDIKFLITSSLQTERDTLKTTRWRNFFIDVCDNSTIITAVTDLHFDLKTQLEWIEEEADPSNIEYSQIQSLITSATQPDRDVLKTNRWRDFFVGVCTNKTMITAVTDLHFDIKTQLEWIEEEASPSNLDYSQIKPLIMAVLQLERDLLKTSKWQNFFVGVCDNKTIKEALEDLNFDFLTTIVWLLDEVSVSNIDFAWLCARFKTSNVFPPGEETIACAIMEREIGDGTFNSSPDHTPASWITMAHNQLLVANKMGVMVGQTATWKPSNQTSGTTFQIWASAAAQGPTPALGAITVINCWEMVMLAAFNSGVLSWTKIHSIYASGVPDWFGFLVNQLSFNNRISYKSGSPAIRPVTGDIVFFDGAAHIALAKGSVDGMGRTEIYSFWPPPNTAFTAGGTIDQVKITTIEQLNDYWVAAGKPAFKIEFATPNWK